MATALHQAWPAARRRFDAVQGWVPSGRVLDLGTGPGWLARALTRPELAVVAVDASSEAVAVAHREGTPLLVQASGDYLPFRGGSFDGIVTLEVLEHVEDPKAVLAECRRLLHSGGRLVVTVPNGFGLYGFLVDRPMDFLGRHTRFAAKVGKLLPSAYLRDRYTVHMNHSIRVHHESQFSLAQWKAVFSDANLTLHRVVATEVVSPLAGVLVRLVFPSSHSRYEASMRRIGALDDWFVAHAPLRAASGWAFLLTSP